MIALGLDPGLCNFGYAVVQLEHQREQLVALGVVRTKKNKDSKLVRDDMHLRCAEIARELRRVTTTWRPDVICSEAFSPVVLGGPRCGACKQPRMQAKTIAQSARIWGLVDMLCEEHKKALLQASPQNIKRRVTGDSNASKAKVLEALDARFGGAVSRHLEKIKSKAAHEHPVDALGAVIALLDDNHFRLALAGAGIGRQRSLDELVV